MSVRSIKKAMRASMKRLRQSIQDDQRAEESAKVTLTLQNTLNTLANESSTPLTVLAFASLPAEIDTWPFLHWVVAQERMRLGLPRVDKETRSLVFHVVDSLSGLNQGALGVMEPSGLLPVVDPEDVDVVVMPGVAFDEEGTRLGMGGGFYDRYLGPLAKATRPRRIAIGLQCQFLQNRLVREEHDVPLHELIMADRTIEWA